MSYTGLGKHMLDQQRRKQLDEELDRWAVGRMLDAIEKIRAGDYSIEQGTQEKLRLTELQERLGFPVGLNELLLVSVAVTARHGRIVVLQAQGFNMYVHFGSSFFADGALCLQLQGRRLVQ